MTHPLVRQIESREAVIGVIGLGYVGLPLALAFGKAGFRVRGFDVDARKPEALLKGESYIRHIPTAGDSRSSSRPAGSPRRRITLRRAPATR